MRPDAQRRIAGRRYRPRISTRAPTASCTGRAASIMSGAPTVENVEVMGSHVGMGLNADVYRVIADRLAMPRRSRLHAVEQVAHRLGMPDERDATRAAVRILDSSADLFVILTKRATRAAGRISDSFAYAKPVPVSAARAALLFQLDRAPHNSGLTVHRDHRA